MFKLYCTLEGFSEGQFLAALNAMSLLPIVDTDLDESLRRARQYNEGGATAWLIEGDDGTRLDKDQIEHVLYVRRHELKGPPKSY